MRISNELPRGKAIFRNRDYDVGPATYLVREIGAAGVPRPSRRELRTIAAIRGYVKSPVLRFAYIGGRFIVYDAVAGPCVASAPGYWVLNGGCNEFYSPTDNFKSTHGVDECWGPPRPWIAHDRGIGKQSWSDYAGWR